MADEQKPQGTPALPGQGDPDAPKYVTEEQLNRAISARLGDFGKKIEKSIETAVGGIGAKLEEVLQRDPKPSGEGNGDDPKAIENHPIVKGLQKQLGDAMKLVESVKTDRDTEKQKARSIALRTKLRDELTKGGLDPKFVNHAVGHLVDAEKRVRFADDESEELVFRDGTTEVDLNTGLKTWMKGDDAKIYLPPRGTQGSGDRPGGKQTSNGQQPPMTAGRALLGMAVTTAQTGGNGQPNE